ncbi:MAG: hypothetical protein QM598_02470 [Protaetiibacter sp.]
MTTTPIRRLAAGATTALLAAGLLLPAATALADEAPLEDPTTTVLDPAPAGETPADDAHEVDPAPEVAPASEVDPAPAETEPAAQEPTEDVADEAAADPAAEAPAPATSEPLVETPMLEPGEAHTIEVPVTDAVEFRAGALGADVDLTVTLPGQTGLDFSSGAGDHVYANLHGAAPRSGTVRLVVRNSGTEARIIPVAFSSAGGPVRLNLGTQLGRPSMYVVVAPLVGGAAREGATGDVTAIGGDGTATTLGLDPFPSSPSNYSATFTGLPPGTYLIEARMRIDDVDHTILAVGRIAAAETTPPNLEYTTEPAAPNANGWFRQPVTARIAASDPGAGVLSVSWRLGGSGAFTEVMTDAVTVGLDTDGVHLLEFHARDNQNNTADTRERTIRIDRTAPSAAIDGLAAGQEFEQDAEVTVDYSCDDALSGIQSCDAPIGTGQLLDTSVAGMHEFTVVATDRAGNVTRETRSYRVLGTDQTPPDLDIVMPQAPASGWFTGPVTLDFTASDEESGVAGIRWTYTSDAGSGEGSTAGEPGTLELTETGVYEVRAWAEDTAGNRSDARLVTVQVDVDVPTVQVTAPAVAGILPNGHYAQNERVVVDFACSDLGSGIAACDATTPAGELLPTGNPGTHELRIVATDVAGNRTERVVSYTVDATPASAPAASRDPRLAQTGAEATIPGIVLVAVLLAAGAMLLATRRLGGR